MSRFEDFHMSDETALRCHRLVQRYSICKSEEKKIDARNKLFMEMRGYLVAWINSNLKKWGRWEDSGEIISLSWHAFMYCMDYYKPHYSNVPAYFFTYTRYYLFTHFAKSDCVHIPLEELKMILNDFPTPENQHFERLLTLYQFRDVLPDQYKKVWDDSMMSLDSHAKNRVSEPRGSGIEMTSYRHMRKAFIPIIKLILGIKEPKKEIAQKCLSNGKTDVE